MFRAAARLEPMSYVYLARNIRLYSNKQEPRWLWHAIDHRSGKVLAYVFGRRQDEVLLKLKALLEPFGIPHYCTDG